MRPRAVEKKFPAIKQSDCKDVSDYPKTSCDYYPNRHKASIYCLPATCLDSEYSSLIFLALCGKANVQEQRGARIDDCIRRLLLFAKCQEMGR